MSLKIGIVGGGRIGNRHAKVYANHQDSEVVAICDLDHERAAAAATEFGAQAFSSVNEMLAADLHLDACSVCTRGEENGSEHYAPTMELLEAGIAVLGEKPISNRIDEGRQMVELAHTRQIPYGINLNHRFTPAALRAKDWIDSGRLGTLHLINMRMWINNPAESSPWFHLRALHPHSIDVMRYFCGDVKSVAAFMMKGEGRTIWSNCQILMQFESGVVGNLTGSYDAGGSYGLERCEVAGSRGRFVLEDACEQLLFCTRDSIATESYSYLGGMRSFDETFDSRISKWIDQLSTGVGYDQIDASGADAFKAQCIIEAAIQAWETRAVVNL